MSEHLSLVISREEVESQNIGPALGVLKSLLASPEKARAYKEGVDVSFAGYDEDPRELFEIHEVRNYVFQLDDQFPFWLFFLSKFGLGLQCLFFCLMPPHLTAEAKARIIPERMARLLEDRWFPAMNHIAQYAGLRDVEVESLSERGVSYLTEGRFRI
jgi:hypothetical protein